MSFSSFLFTLLCHTCKVLSQLFPNLIYFRTATRNAARSVPLPMEPTVVTGRAAITHVWYVVKVLIHPGSVVLSHSNWT